jgi:hypothetical protein
VGVSAFLGSLPAHDVTAESTGSEDGRLIVRGRDSRRLVITTYLGPDLASVNIGIEADSGVAPEPDPRHRAFYEIWEGMLGLGDSEVEALDGRRRAVFYVGLLEAEVMNGGPHGPLGLHLAVLRKHFAAADQSQVRWVDDPEEGRCPLITPSIASVALCSLAHGTP